MPRMPRSLLFVPAHIERMVAKAAGLNADAVLLDLEDAVPPAQKVAARARAARYLAESAGSAIVRINALDARTSFSTPCGREDIDAIVQPSLRGLMLPKAESANDIVGCDALIRDAERRSNLIEGAVELYVIIETAKGVSAAIDVARAPIKRSLRLCFGAGDYTTDIGVEWTREEEESRVARSLVVIASRAAGLPPPVDSVFTGIDDVEALRQSALKARALGFSAKMVIHPKQINVVNQVFSPTPAEITWAQEILAALEKHERAGEGAFVVAGKMIDYPIVERAKRILEVQSYEAVR